MSGCSVPVVALRQVVRALLVGLMTLVGVVGSITPAWADLPAPAGAPTHIRAELVVERAARPGTTVTVAVLMTPDNGWHGYWTNPGDAGLPLALDWRLPAGVTAGTPQFPVPTTLVVAHLMNHVYERAYAVLVPLTVPASARPGATLAIAAHADWLACTTTVCVPESGELAATVQIAGPATTDRADTRFDAWRAALPATLDQPARFAATATGYAVAIPFPASAPVGQPHLFAAGDGLIDYAAPQAFRRNGDWLIVDLARTRSPLPERPQTFAGLVSFTLAGSGAKDPGAVTGISFVARPGPIPAGGMAVGEPVAGAPAPGGFAWGTLLLAIGGALLGGLVLNAMPCVFPILSLKALALARGNSHHAHEEALAYTAGVVLACLALGGAMLALRAAGTEVGWAFQLQEPGVVAALLLLSVAITANFAGVFELPALSVESAGSGTGTIAGAFGTGLLAAFVATPCTGPFMATAIGVALVLPWWAALAVFAALGLGLALPFLAIGFVPRLRKLLPRPGAWMVRFRHAMAVPMALTVLALAWLAWRLGGAGFAGASVVLAAALGAALWWYGRGQRAGEAPTRLALAVSLGALALAGGVAPRLVAAPAAAALDGAVPFSEAALAEARAAGHPVFAYFTADWCLTCKVNESVAIDREVTRDAFAKAGVVVMVGDWTRRDPAITRFLGQQGAGGVPLYLWYAPHAAQPQHLPQVLDTGLLTGLAVQGSR